MLREGCTCMARASAMRGEVVGRTAAAASVNLRASAQPTGASLSQHGGGGREQAGGHACGAAAGACVGGLEQERASGECGVGAPAGGGGAAGRACRRAAGGGAWKWRRHACAQGRHGRPQGPAAAGAAAVEPYSYSPPRSLQSPTIAARCVRGPSSRCVHMLCMLRMHCRQVRARSLVSMRAHAMHAAHALPPGACAVPRLDACTFYACCACTAAPRSRLPDPQASRCACWRLPGASLVASAARITHSLPRAVCSGGAAGPVRQFWQLWMPSLLCAGPSAVEGQFVVEGFLSEAEEAAVLAAVDSAEPPWTPSRLNGPSRCAALPCGHRRCTCASTCNKRMHLRRALPRCPPRPPPTAHPHPQVNHCECSIVCFVASPAAQASCTQRMHLRLHTPSGACLPGRRSRLPGAHAWRTCMACGRVQGQEVGRADGPRAAHRLPGRAAAASGAAAASAAHARLSACACGLPPQRGQRHRIPAQPRRLPPAARGRQARSSCPMHGPMHGDYLLPHVDDRRAPPAPCMAAVPLLLLFALCPHCGLHRHACEAADSLA